MIESRIFARARRAVAATAIGVVVLLGCGVPVAAAASCKLATVAEWPVRTERNVLLVDGAVNGQPARVLLDTGATRTLLFRAAATRFNVARTDARRDRMFGVGGETKVEIAFLNEFRVGELKRAPYRMMIAGDRDFGADVILGEDFLSLVDVEFDLAHNVVRLFQPQDCDGVALAYWATAATTVGEVAFDAVQVTNPQIMLDVALDGKKISALLDSGASLSVLDKPAAALLGVTPETPGVIVAGKNAGLGGKLLPVWRSAVPDFHDRQRDDPRHAHPILRPLPRREFFRGRQPHPDQAGGTVTDADRRRLPAVASRVDRAQPESDLLHLQRRPGVRMAAANRAHERKGQGGRRDFPRPRQIDSFITAPASFRAKR